MNIIFLLLSLGLAIIPFVMWPGFDTREPKMAAALVFALSLSLVGIFQGKLKPFRNKWLLILIGYLLVNILFCPKPETRFADMLIGSFWVWKPLSYILIFFLMLVTVSSIKFAELERMIIFKIIAWVGLVTSVYAILQFFGIDQFYILSSLQDTANIPSARVGGTLGQPTIVASFIVMTIPICLYLKKYWFAGIMILAVFLCKSQVAIGALIITALFLLSFKNRKTAINVSVLFIAFTIIGCVGYFNNPKVKSLVGDSGRFMVWKQSVVDMNIPLAPGLVKKYPITGMGLGSFKYIQHVKNNNKFWQAHNEYIEILYNTGLVGIVLFLMAIFTALRVNINRESKYLLSSFVCIALCAGGTFVWQLGPHLFYTIVILGFLNQEEA